MLTKGCHSDVEANCLIAAISRGSVKNLSKLPSQYKQEDYTKTPHAKFTASSTVFFLTGGTRHKASANAFKSLAKKKTGQFGQQMDKKGPKSSRKSKDQEVWDKRDLLSQPTLQFKLANWIVQLYDIGMYIVLDLMLVFISVGRQITTNGRADSSKLHSKHLIALSEQESRCFQYSADICRVLSRVLDKELQSRCRENQRIPQKPSSSRPSIQKNY